MKFDKWISYCMIASDIAVYSSLKDNLRLVMGTSVDTPLSRAD
jgi:hypothetical protein